MVTNNPNPIDPSQSIQNPADLFKESLPSGEVLGQSTKEAAMGDPKFFMSPSLSTGGVMGYGSSSSIQSESSLPTLSIPSDMTQSNAKIAFSVAKEHLTKALSYVSTKGKEALGSLNQDIKPTKNAFKAKLGSLSPSNATNLTAQANFDKIKNALQGSSKNIKLEENQTLQIQEENVLSDDADLIQNAKTMAAPEGGKLLAPHEANAFKIGLSMLQKGQSTEQNVNGQTFILAKDSKGKTDVFLKQNSIGIGVGGEAFKAISARTGESVVVKLSHSDNTKATDDLKNEQAILSLLNDSSSEGIQGNITLSKLAGSDGQYMAVGTLYSEGDMLKPTMMGKISTFIGVSVEKISLATDEQISRAVDNTLDHFITILEDPSVSKEEKKAAWSTLKNEVNNHIRYGVERSLSEQFIISATPLDKEVSKFLGTANIPVENLGGKIKDVFAKPMIENAKKSRSQAPQDLSTRLNKSANLLRGLNHIHSHNVFHGDIKPANFFHSKDASVIADFGDAQKKDGDYKIGRTVTRGYVPNTHNDAYEAYTENKDYENAFIAGKAMDQYSMAVSLNEMLTGGILPSQDADAGSYGTAIAAKLRETGISEDKASIAETIINKMTTVPPGNKAPDPLPTTYGSHLATSEELLQLADILSGR